MAKFPIQKVLQEQTKGTTKRDLVHNEEVLQHASLLLSKANVTVTENNSLVIETEPKEYKIYVIDSKKLYVVSVGFNDGKGYIKILNNINEVKLKSEVETNDVVYCKEIQLDNINIVPSEDTLGFDEFIDTAIKTF